MEGERAVVHGMGCRRRFGVWGDGGDGGGDGVGGVAVSVGGWASSTRGGRAGAAVPTRTTGGAGRWLRLLQKRPLLSVGRPPLVDLGG